MSIIHDFGISGTNSVYNDILEDLKKNGKASYSNDVAGWFAISRDNLHMIEFYEKDEIKFYKNSKSWAKRVAQLLNRGY